MLLETPLKAASYFRVFAGSLLLKMERLDSPLFIKQNKGSPGMKWIDPEMKKEWRLNCFFKSKEIIGFLKGTWSLGKKERRLGVWGAEGAEQHGRMKLLHGAKPSVKTATHTNTALA